MANLTLKTVFSAIDRMSGPMKSITGKMEKFNTVAGKVARMGAAFVKGVAAVGAASLVAGVAVFKATEAFAERGDDIARNAGILGLTAEGYQELSYAAMMADVETESFTAASKKLNANLGQLKMKQGALYTALSKTNPALARQLRNAKNTDEAFQLVADAISSETDVQKRATLAVAAFGKTGQDLIPMMEGLNDARKEARASGAIISDKDITAASRLDDSLKRIKAIGIGALNSTLGALADKLAPIVDRMTAWISANRELIASKIESTISKVGDIIGFIASPGVISGLAALAIGIKAVGVASMVLGAGNPMIMAVGVLAGLITLIVANWDKITGFFDRLDKQVYDSSPFLQNVKAKEDSLNANVAQSPAARAANDLAAYMAAQNGTPLTSENALEGASTLVDPLARMQAQENARHRGAPLAPAPSSSTTTSRSILDLNINGLPPGSSAKQTGQAPGITVNLGNTMRRQGN